jgi:hypothetical protein
MKPSPFGTALFQVIQEHRPYWDKRELEHPTISSTILCESDFGHFAEPCATGSPIESFVPAREYSANCPRWATVDKSWRA